jgi:hypothetical protein
VVRSDTEPRGGAALGGANLLLRFLLELAMLAAFLTWGFRVVEPIWLRVVLGLAAPAVALFVWGAFIAPKAPMRREDPGRLGVEIVLFGLAAAGLAIVGLAGWGIALAVIAALNIAILHALKLR